jgi:UDP-N-acetylmuramate dehydrogenase
MQIDNLEKFSKELKGKLLFNYSLKNSNWFNIGGKTKAYFKPDDLSDLVRFLKEFGNREKIIILGVGSNILINDNYFDGIVIKLGKNFSNISLLPNKMIVAGSATTDVKLSKFASENSIGGLEFLSCIPGTVGGGLRMNSGCYGKEFKDILVSVQAIDKKGNMFTIPATKIKFGYRECDLSRDLIFLSASFKGEFKDKKEIDTLTNKLKNQKEVAQPTRVKTGGSTFKNPIKQTNKKVWELIKNSVPSDTKFGDAEISLKHSNFLVNKNNASFSDMKSLIDLIKKKVLLKTGIKLETEIEIIE